MYIATKECLLPRRLGVVVSVQVVQVVVDVGGLFGVSADAVVEHASSFSALGSCRKKTGAWLHLQYQTDRLGHWNGVEAFSNDYIGAWLSVSIHGIDDCWDAVHNTKVLEATHKTFRTPSRFVFCKIICFMRWWIDEIHLTSISYRPIKSGAFVVYLTQAMAFVISMLVTQSKTLTILLPVQWPRQRS